MNACQVAEVLAEALTARYRPRSLRIAVEVWDGGHYARAYGATLHSAETVVYGFRADELPAGWQTMDPDEFLRAFDVQHGYEVSGQRLRAAVQAIRAEAGL